MKKKHLHGIILAQRDEIQEIRAENARLKKLLAVDVAVHKQIVGDMHPTNEEIIATQEQEINELREQLDDSVPLHLYDAIESRMHMLQRKLNKIRQEVGE